MSESDQSGERPFSALPKPEAAESPSPEKPARLGWFNLPDGALGFFVLLLLAATCGGLIAVYWPWLTGAGPEQSALTDRVSALESRVDQIAVGQAPKAAAASFDDLKRTLSGLKDRLDADEARLAAVEKSSGTAGGTDAAGLKATIDKNSSDIAQLGQRIDALAPGAKGASAPQFAALKSDLDAQMKTASAALDKLGARVADLEKTAPPADLTQQIDGLGTRIAALEKTAPPADLAQRLDALATKSELEAVGTRVGHLENQDLAGLVRRAAAVMALADLVRASEREEPFDNELAALRSVMPTSPDLADLAKYARKGVPTVSTLAARFRGDLDSILAAERAAQAHNWLERAWSDIVDLVSVRPVGNIPGNGTEPRLARSEFALEHGDLAAAVHEVEGLDAPAKGAAASWLKDAKARLQVDRDARDLTNRVVASLAAAQLGQDAKPQTDAQ